MALLTPQAYADSVRTDADALARAAEGNLTLPVPSCPAWTVRDLVIHVAEVHEFWRRVVDGRLLDLDRADRDIPTPADRSLVAWMLGGAHQLAGLLAATDPAIPVWSWSAQKDVAFVQRRMAQETSVHRWDGESAAGAPAPIEAGLAVDGVDEFLDIHMPAEEAPLTGADGVLELRQADGSARWLLRIGDGTVAVSRPGVEEAVGADPVLTGSASDLLLLLWRRVPLDAVVVDGDPGPAERFLAWMDLT